jgi:hypothetical protein
MQYVLRNGEYMIIDSIEQGDVIVPEKPGANYKLVNNEWVIDLDVVKANKIAELTDICNKTILKGFSSKAFDGTTDKFYTADYNDQARMAGLVSIAQLVLAGLSTEPLRWKASDELECYVWTPQSILALGLDLKKHVEANTNKFYELRIQVLNATDENTINSVVW